MDRDQAFEWVKKELANDNLVKHVLAVESIMMALAVDLDCDVQKWGLAGILHDIDLAKTAKRPHKHTLIAEQWLNEKQVEADIIYAIKAHCDQVPPVSKMDWALYCSDPVSGLIVASALTHPSRKLNGICVEFLLKRYKEKRFAAGASREAIASCGKLSLSLEEFLNIALAGMKTIGDQIGL